MASSVLCPEGVAVAVTTLRVTLEVLYRGHFANTWRVLRRLGVPEAQLDDAAQDVFLVVHRKLEQFDARLPARSWIFAIAVRVASEYRKRAVRRRTEQLDEAVADASTNPARMSELKDSVRFLHEVLSVLDEKSRTVFVFAELEEMSVPEIAQVLDVNMNTVYSRLRTARKRFEAELLRRRAANAEAPP